VRRPAGQVPVLDALRSLAVLLVVADHTMSWWGKVGGRALPIRHFPLFHWGWTGVDLFFILSGYLIGRQLWREYDKTGTVRVGRFVIRRGLRIWPLYLAFAIGTPLLAGVRFHYGDWLFISNYTGGTVMGGWSLSTEEQFYILLPAAVAILGRLFGLRGWLVALPAMLAAVQLARYFTGSALMAQGMSLARVKIAMYSPGHLHCEGLFVGALISLVHVIRPGAFAPAKTSRRVAAAVAFGIGGALLAGVLRAVGPATFPFLSLALMYGGFAVMLLLLRDANLIGRLGLRSIHLYRISRLSFGVYLNHFHVVKWFLAAVTPGIMAVFGNGHVSFLTSLVLATLLSLVASAVTFIAIEHPFLLLRETVLAMPRFADAARRRPVVEPRGVPNPSYSLPLPATEPREPRESSGRG
jgi:peptidoglycan/LPS O-acetylase OafA/YrhL